MRSFFEFLGNLKKFGLEFFGRYYSIYPGVVVDVNDPDRRGRIKVILPTILGDGQVHHAWVEPTFVPLAGKSHGEFMVPYVGDHVSILFENGDIRFPIYRGGTYAKEELSSGFRSNYGQVRGWTFKNGTQILVDETSGTEKILIQTHSGTKIELTGDKKVTVFSNEVHIDSGLVTVGSSANFSAVLGEKLAELFDRHTHMTPVGVSSAPVPPNTAAQVNAAESTAFLASHVKVKGNV